MARYRDDILEFLENRLVEYPEVEARPMFGHPGFSIGSRVFAFVYADGLSLKLPRELYDRVLNEEGIIPFSPRKTPMGTWVVLRLPDADDYAGRWDLIEAAMDYIVTAEADPKKKKKQR